MELTIRKSFSENVCYLIIIGNKMNAKFFFVTFSLTKWMSSSTCLVFAWYTGLLAKAITPWLSHRKIGIVNILKCNFDNKACIHITFAVAKASAWYSNSLLDLETKCCFLDELFYRWPHNITSNWFFVFAITNPVSMRESIKLYSTMLIKF